MIMRALFIAIVSKNGLDIKYLGCNAKKDENIALIALKNNKRAFKYLDESLKNNKNFIIKAVNIECVAFEDISNLMQLDRDVVLHFINNNIGLLSKISPNLLEDEELALSALSQNWSISIKFLDKKFDNDEYKKLSKILYNISLVQLEKKIFDIERFDILDVILDCLGDKCSNIMLKFMKNNTYKFHNMVINNQCSYSDLVYESLIYQSKTTFVKNLLEQNKSNNINFKFL
jgi:hypothetical protein